MKKIYRNIEEVLRSPWANLPAQGDAPALTDRLLRSTRLEDSIYTDLRTGDTTLDEVEKEANQKLRSFPALSRDIFQAFYTLRTRWNEEGSLSPMAQRFNRKILDHVMQGEDFSTIKNICEGRELPAYESAAEFITRTAGELDSLLSQMAGDKGALNTLENLQRAEQQAAEELTGLLERLRQSQGENETLEKAALEAANQAESKRRQVEAVGKLIDTSTTQHKEAIQALLSASLRAAKEKAEEVQTILQAWSDDPARMERNEVNQALLDHVRRNPVLKEISKYLGRYRELLARMRKNSYAYGRGEKYTLELGNDLTRALTSELAMLASPLTTPLFLRKYQQKRIKQYKRREPVFKGMGDIICCLDESDSTKGDNAAWGKAVALTLLEIAAEGGRNFALIHFSSKKSCQTHMFRPGQYTVEDKVTAAETFLGGGTNFETPMREALRLIESEGFRQADIVFITDGACSLPEAFLDELGKVQAAYRFSVTGILLDAGQAAMDFSLKSFCKNIYRTSEMMASQIAEALIRQNA